MLSKLRGSHFALVPVAVVVILAGSVAGAGTASAGRMPARHQHSTEGTVASVNGVATAGTCGSSGAVTADVPFTFAGHGRGGTVTVEVTSSTTFTDPAVTTPSFADVCVGGHVKVQGTFAAGTLTAAAVAVLPPPAVHAQGIVTTVGGVAVAGTCGTATVNGTVAFTLASVGRWAIGTVDVNSTTTFTDTAIVAPAMPSFADLCVGSRVQALGVVVAGTLTATSVAIEPPPLVSAEGVVTAINGVSTKGICATSGATVPFTLTGFGHWALVTTVTVTATTTFTDPALVSPALASYADVCVGLNVKALGTSAAGALAAVSVAVLPPPTIGTRGSVSSVGGVSTPGTCATANTTGIFTLVGMRRALVTVDVVAATIFIDSALVPPATPSFADVCVGSEVQVLGTFSAGTLTATSVAVLPPPMVGAQGIVSAVNGTSTAGTCGTGTTGLFTLVGMHGAIVTVDVSPTTIFTDPMTAASALPSFAEVCVGSYVRALGASTSTALMASSVAILGPRHLSRGHRNLRGGGQS